MKRTEPRLHEQLTPTARLSLLAALLDADEAEFAVARDAVGVSDSVLSRHMSVLEGAGLLRVRKGYVARRPRTWLALTDEGRQAYAEHRAALLRILKSPAR